MIPPLLITLRTGRLWLPLPVVLLWPLLDRRVARKMV